MVSIKLACEINARGLSLLNAGDIDRAAYTFQKAIVVVRRLMNLCHTTMPSTKIQQTLYASTIQLWDVHRKTSDSIYSYACPLQLRDYDNEEDLESYLILTSAQLLFNLALTNQRRGKESDLADAASLYQLIFQMLEMHTQVSAAARTLSVLALNNKALIHCEQCDFHQAAECFQSLSQFLALFGDDSYTLESTLDMNEILLNVLVFQLPMTAGAA